MIRLLLLSFSVMAAVAACSHDADEDIGPCGGLAGGDCTSTQYCAYTHGTCGASDDLGACTERPGTCPDYVDPVCGCDGKTYANECYAKNAGVDVDVDANRCR